MQNDRDELLLAPTPAVKPRRKRRKYSTAQKVEMVEATLFGESASEVARRFDVNANLLFKWRKLYDSGQLQNRPGLIPVQVNQQPATDGDMTIEFTGGQRLTLRGEVSDRTLQTVLAVLCR